MTAAVPATATIARYRDDPHWRDLVLFYEYFHGDTGRGVGASHQTGWTALVTHLLGKRGGGEVMSVHSSNVDHFLSSAIERGVTGHLSLVRLRMRPR